MCARAVLVLSQRASLPQFLKLPFTQCTWISTPPPLLLHNTDGKKLKESCHQWEAVFHSIHSICSILFRLLFTCCCGQRSENKQIRQGLSSTVFSTQQAGELSYSSRKATHLKGRVPLSSGASHLRYLSSEVPLISGTSHLRYLSSQYLSAGASELRCLSSEVPDCQIAPLDEVTLEVTLQIGAVKCQPRCERSQKVKSGNARCQNLVAGVPRLYIAELLNLKHGSGTKTDFNFRLKGRYHI